MKTILNGDDVKDKFTQNQAKVAEKIAFDKKAYICHLKV